MVGTIMNHFILRIFLPPRLVVRFFPPRLVVRFFSSFVKVLESCPSSSVGTICSSITKSCFFFLYTGLKALAAQLL